MPFHIRCAFALIVTVASWSVVQPALAAPATRPAGAAGRDDEPKALPSIFDFGMEPLTKGDGGGGDEGRKPEPEKPKSGGATPAPAEPNSKRPDVTKPATPGGGKPEGKQSPAVTPDVAEMLKSCHVSPDGVVTVDEAITFGLPGTRDKDFVITGDLYPTSEPILYNTGGVIFHFRQLTGTQRYELSVTGMRVKRTLLGGEKVPKFAYPMKFEGIARDQWHTFRVEVTKDQITARFGDQKGVAPGPLETRGDNHMIIGPGAKLRNLKVQVSGDVKQDRPQEPPPPPRLPTIELPPAEKGAGGDRSQPLKLDPRASYECLLGVYTNEGKPVPFVNLNIPTGKDLLTDDIRAQMRGRISLGEMGYVGRGYIVIPKAGAYKFDQSFGSVKINDKSLGLDHKKGTVELPKGTFQIDVSVNSHGQPYTDQARIAIHPKGEATTIPITNSGRDIQRFLGNTIGGAKPTVVTPFDPETRKVKDAREK